ncbi:MAG TPA: type II toxin-antitoxin system Phd/YefM family antitoxin [Candidatus Acidoferrum sp.]|nr:type II toxin-antitoxin system Phd/YefM family antitoxin [Candidatus Acidoferrum sp.]
MARTATKRIARIIPALTARTQFGQILRRAARDQERFVVEKRGEPGVVIMSVEEYLRNFVKPGSVVDEIHEYVRKKGLKPLSMRAINKEIRRYRSERRAKKANG